MRILICDDHAVFRAGLRSVLTELEAELDEASSSAEALERLAADGGTDLVLLDLRMPGVDGFETLGAMRESHPSVPVVIVSASEDPREVRAALDAGASGFIPKSSSAELLRSALQVVLSGGVYVPAEALQGAPAGESSVSHARRSDRARQLTPRQREVLDLLARGLTNREIGDVLKISETTVKTHIGAVLDALDVTNRTEAALVLRQIEEDEGAER